MGSLVCFAASQLSAGFPVGQMSGQSAVLCAGVGGSEARAIALRKMHVVVCPPPSGGRGRVRKPASTRVLHVPAALEAAFGWMRSRSSTVHVGFGWRLVRIGRHV